MLATQKGMAIRFPEKQVRPMGRQAHGVNGIRLRKGDRVVGMAVVREDDDLLVTTEKGFGKRTALAEYRPQTRGGLGLKTLQIAAKNGPLVDMKVVDDEDELLVITEAGHIIRQRVGAISRIGRATQGVRLIRLDAGDRVATIARVIRKELAPES
jgi:DNA gyrase subunit A